MNTNLKLEIKARAFQLETGMLAPFKDDRSGEHTEEKRSLA